MGENVAIYGITGALGREIQVALESEHEGIGRFFPVAGIASAGATVTWRGASIPVLGNQAVDPAAVDIAVFATPGVAARSEAPRLAHAGARIIDASGTLARAPMPQGIPAAAPVFWPGLSSGLEAADDLDIATLPGGTASTVAPILEALILAHGQDATLLPRLQSVDLTVFRGASSAGRSGIQALSSQTVSLLNYQPVLDPAPFPAALAFNLFATPAEDALWDEGRSVGELRALLPTLALVPINIVQLQVATYSGTGVSLTLRFDDIPSLERLRTILSAHPDLELAAASPRIPDSDGTDEEDAEDGEGVTPNSPDTDASDDHVLALRDALDSDRVLLQDPTVGEGGVVRIVAMADPLHRTAVACQLLISRWLEQA